jgi:phosphate transport system substrate-binding protein
MALRDRCARRGAATLSLLIFLFVVASPAQDAITIVGSGSNLPRPLYDAWAGTFNQRNTKAQVRYLPIGTVESIKQISNGSGDFGGGEVQLTPEVLAGTRLKIVALPVALVAVVPIYHLPGLNDELRFSGSVLADIYLGKIHNWNDPEIAKINPGVKLPDLGIEVVHRAPGKGANYILTDFLSKVSPAFRQRIGKSASPNWVLGRSAMRNEDMSEQVASTVGAIGYVELNYAAQGVSVGLVQNAAGRFVKASPESVERACKAATGAGVHNLQVSLTNAPGADSYPLSSYTYVYLPQNVHDKDRVKVLADFVEFVLGEGQSVAANKNYAALPGPVLQMAKAKVHSWATSTAASN